MATPPGVALAAPCCVRWPAPTAGWWRCPPGRRFQRWRLERSPQTGLAGASRPALRRVAVAAGLAVVVLLVGGAHLGERSGRWATSQPRREADPSTADGHVIWLEGQPLQEDLGTFISGVEVMTGRLPTEAITGYARSGRTAYPFLVSLLTSVTGSAGSVYAGFVASISLLVGRGVALYALARQATGSEGAGIAAGAMVATGIGFAFATGATMSTVAAVRRRPGGVVVHGPAGRLDRPLAPLGRLPRRLPRRRRRTAQQPGALLPLLRLLQLQRAQRVAPPAAVGRHGARAGSGVELVARLGGATGGGVAAGQRTRRPGDGRRLLAAQRLDPPAARRLGEGLVGGASWARPPSPCWSCFLPGQVKGFAEPSSWGCTCRSTSPTGCLPC